MGAKQKADLSLLFVTLCWGSSYYFSDICLLEVSPLMLNGIRFLFAFVAAFLVMFKKAVNINKSTLLYSILLGFVMSIVYVGATVGLYYTTQSNAGFLCALAVVLTPLLKWIFQKKRPEKKLFAVMILAVTGVGLMSLSDSFTLGIGDIMCLSCSLSYAIHLMITERVVAKESTNAIALAVYQIGFCGIFNVIFSFIFEQPTYPKSPITFAYIALLAIFCTMLTIVIQTVAQKHTTAETVGVIFTAEPVFAAIIAFLFAGEILTPRGYIGMAILFIAILLMELDVSKIFKRKKSL